MSETILCAVQDAPDKLSVTALASDAEALSEYLQGKGIHVSGVSPRKIATFGQTRVPQFVRQFTADTNIDLLAEHATNWANGL